MMARWPSAESLMATFHVDRQVAYTRDPSRCHFGKAPTLNAVNAAFGRGTAEEWLTFQLGNLSEFSGAREKITNEQIGQLAQLIRGDYGFLNMAEMMLFCRRFKAGHYGEFYGSVDPITIMRGLRAFCTERANAIAKHDDELEKLRQAEWKAKAVTYKEHLAKMKIKKTK